MTITFSSYKALHPTLDQDVIESKLLICSHLSSASFPSNYSDDSSLEILYMDDNDNEGVEVEIEDQHRNDIITIADDISALNTKQKAVIATPFLPASSYLSIESDLMTHIPLCPHTSILNAIPLQKCPSCIRVNVFSQ